MNPGQEKFYEFIMGKVAVENKDRAKALLEESFAKQADGTCDSAYLMAFVPRMLELIKPESAEEVKAIMTNFAAQGHK